MNKVCSPRDPWQLSTNPKPTALPLAAIAYSTSLYYMYMYIVHTHTNIRALYCVHTVGITVLGAARHSRKMKSTEVLNPRRGFITSGTKLDTYMHTYACT